MILMGSCGTYGYILNLFSCSLLQPAPRCPVAQQRCTASRPRLREASESALCLHCPILTQAQGGSGVSPVPLLPNPDSQYWVPSGKMCESFSAGEMQPHVSIEPWRARCQWCFPASSVLSPQMLMDATILELSFLWEHYVFTSVGSSHRL